MLPLSNKSITILFIITIALTITLSSTASVSFAKSKADKLSLPETAMQHVPTGEADLQWNATTQTLAVTITMTGLAPNSTHVAAIQYGDNPFAHCHSPMTGKTIYMLSPLKVNKFGNVHALKTTLTHVQSGIPDSGWYLSVLNNSQLSTNPQPIRIACGEIGQGIPKGGPPPPVGLNTTLPSPTPIPTTKDQSVHVYLEGSADNDQSVVGNAAISLNHGTITVIFSLGNLVPNSRHAASIHNGTCESQGPIIFPLNDVIADKKGQSGSKTTIPASIATNTIKKYLPTTSSTTPSISDLARLPWYITVSEASSKSEGRGSVGSALSQASVDAIACGNFSQLITIPTPAGPPK